MWEPNIAIDKWLNIHDCLKVMAANAKCKCGSKMEAESPLVYRDHVGVRCKKCDCGRKGLRLLSVRRPSTVSESMLRALRRERD